MWQEQGGAVGWEVGHGGCGDGVKGGKLVYHGGGDIVQVLVRVGKCLWASGGLVGFEVT